MSVYKWPPQSESSFRRKPESRVPGENRDPVFEMVPDFRRDNVWMPDQVRHDGKGLSMSDLSANILPALLHLRQTVPEALLLPDQRFNGKEHHYHSGRQKEYRYRALHKDGIPSIRHAK